MKKKKGFTLAELLITLTMIGIVATLVIPPVAQRFQEAQLKIAFKENYSIIDKAVQKAILDNGGTFAGLMQSGTLDLGWVDDDVMVDVLAPYFNYVKKSETPGECWHPENTLKMYNGSYFNGGTNAKCLMLTNGATFFTWAMSSNCTKDEGGGYLTCGNIYIDVNGFKGPNVVGKDVFLIYVQADRAYPAGAKGMMQGDCANPGVNGFGCAVKVLLNQDY